MSKHCYVSASNQSSMTKEGDWSSMDTYNRSNDICFIYVIDIVDNKLELQPLENYEETIIIGDVKNTRGKNGFSKKKDKKRKKDKVKEYFNGVDKNAYKVYSLIKIRNPWRSNITKTINNEKIKNAEFILACKKVIKHMLPGKYRLSIEKEKILKTITDNMSKLRRRKDNLSLIEIIQQIEYDTSMFKLILSTNSLPIDIYIKLCQWVHFF